MLIRAIDDLKMTRQLAEFRLTLIILNGYISLSTVSKLPTLAHDLQQGETFPSLLRHFEKSGVQQIIESISRSKELIVQVGHFLKAANASYMEEASIFP